MAVGGLRCEGNCWKNEAFPVENTFPLVFRDSSPTGLLILFLVVQGREFYTSDCRELECVCVLCGVYVNLLKSVKIIQQLGSSLICIRIILFALALFSPVPVENIINISHQF